MRRQQRGIAFNRHFDGEGAIIYKHACALGCEGIVSKRLGSPYRSGRQDCWIKVRKSCRGSDTVARRSKIGANAGSPVPTTLDDQRHFGVSISEEEFSRRSIRPVTRKAARHVPALSPYDFAVVQGRLLIVSPRDMIVAEVIRGPRKAST